MRKMVSRVAAGLVALAVLVTFAPAAWAETGNTGVETVTTDTGLDAGLVDLALDGQPLDGELSHAHVPLDEFPQASSMKGAVYQDTWENVGLTGVGTGVMPSSGGNAWWLPLALVAAMGCGALTARKRD